MSVLLSSGQWSDDNFGFGGPATNFSAPFSCFINVDTQGNNLAYYWNVTTGGSEIDTGPTPVEDFTNYFVKVMGTNCGDENRGGFYCNNAWEDCDAFYCLCCEPFKMGSCSQDNQHQKINSKYVKHLKKK